MNLKGHGGLRVGILGGAFDPVTCAHVDLACYAVEQYFDAVWLQPCYKHMLSKEMASYYHRVEMIKLAVDCRKGVEASTFEINREMEAPTYEVFREMQKATKGFPIKFRWLIGTDNANNIEKWARHAELIEEVPFTVFGRKDHPIQEDAWYMSAPHDCFDDFQSEGVTVQTYCLTKNVSSTLVRDGIKDDVDVSPYLSLDVEQYIKEKGLYK